MMHAATRYARSGRYWLPPLCAALAFMVPALSVQRASAQYAQAAMAQQRVDFTQRELDRMLAPIALYSDSLLSQILMAATYPLEVVEAARWSQANPRLQGREAVAAVEHMPWDPSVKSLVAFPRILATMNERLQWTRDLGDAFLEQEPHVMQTIQDLRRRAIAAGTLRSSPEVHVEQRDRLVYIEPADAAVAYVPYYDPVVVYGTWWWPAYPPVWWAPWPGYVVGPYYASAYYWGPAITVGTAFFFGAFDWHRRHATVVHRHQHIVVDRTAFDAHLRPQVGSRWIHDPHHRRGVDYRSERVRQRIAAEQRAAHGDREGRPPLSVDERRAAAATPGTERRLPPARRADRNAQPLPPSRSDEPTRRERAGRSHDRTAADASASPAPSGTPGPASQRERPPRNAATNESADRIDRGQRRDESRDRDVERRDVPNAARSGAIAPRAEMPRNAATDRTNRGQRPDETRGRSAERAPAAASPAPSRRNDDRTPAALVDRSRAAESHPGRGALQRRESAEATRREPLVREQPAISAGAVPRIEHAPRISQPQPRAVAPAPAIPRSSASERGAARAESRGPARGQSTTAREHGKGHDAERAGRQP